MKFIYMLIGWSLFMTLSILGFIEILHICHQFNLDKDNVITFYFVLDIASLVIVGVGGIVIMENY